MSGRGGLRGVDTRSGVPMRCGWGWVWMGMRMAMGVGMGKRARICVARAGEADQ